MIIAFLQVRFANNLTRKATAIGMENIIDTIQIPSIINFETYFDGLALEK